MKPIKPLGHKAYGSIPHLPGSRRGPADKGLSDQQASILTEKARDKHDVIIVQEKLDGSNVSVAKINGEIVPLTRAGYRACESHYKQHHMFHDWVMIPNNKWRFKMALEEGDRIVGEWLAQAHGTIYKLTEEPFVVFDIMNGHKRTPMSSVGLRAVSLRFILPKLIHWGGPISIADVLSRLEPSGHGAVDGVEGAVWRVERKGEVDFLGKYVRPDKEDGKYLESKTGQGPVWNWTP